MKHWTSHVLYGSTMEISLGLIHLDPEPLRPSDEQVETLRALSGDLLLATGDPGEHLHLEPFNLVAPLVPGGALAATHALLLAAQHDRLLVLGTPVDEEQLALARELAASPDASDLLIHPRSAGIPPLPARLDRACLRPLERAVLRDPGVNEFPPGLRARRL